MNETQLSTCIRKLISKALNDFRLIEGGDRILVAVSGGKDSAILLKMLLDIRKRSPLGFEFQAVLLDQKQPGFDPHRFIGWVESLGLSLTIISEDTHTIVKQKVKPGKSFCGLCSRLRRGILYNYAHENGFNKIALGHHRDDLNETVLMNMFYSGKIASMPAKLISDDGRNTVIRPMVYVPEQWLATYASAINIPVIPCNLCGSQDGLKRQKIKALLKDMEGETPFISENLLSAQANIRKTQLLDLRLWDPSHENERN